MPKKARTPEEIQEVKQKILDMALELISKDGYENFSMRKLATSLHITATTIYQYYSNKDELYLAVLTSGFEELYSRMLNAYQAGGTPMEKLKRVILEYISFGLTQSNFYNIMMVWNVPKYYDYAGTAAEPVAITELNTALQPWDLLKLILSELEVFSKMSPEVREITTYQMVCSIHGFVTLINSKNVEYMFEDRMKAIDDGFINRFLAFVISSINKPCEE